VSHNIHRVPVKPYQECDIGTARVIPGTPSQAEARSAQATPGSAGGGWELQQAATPVAGSLASPGQGTPGVYRAPNRPPLAAQLPPRPARQVGGGTADASMELQEVSDAISPTALSSPAKSYRTRRHRTQLS
jgi:hypothetical protein